MANKQLLCDCAFCTSLISKVNLWIDTATNLNECDCKLCNESNTCQGNLACIFSDKKLGCKPSAQNSVGHKKAKKNSREVALLAI